MIALRFAAFSALIFCLLLTSPCSISDYEQQRFLTINVRFPVSSSARADRLKKPEGTTDTYVPYFVDQIALAISGDNIDSESTLNERDEDGQISNEFDFSDLPLGSTVNLDVKVTACDETGTCIETHEGSSTLELNSDFGNIDSNIDLRTISGKDLTTIFPLPISIQANTPISVDEAYPLCADVDANSNFAIARTTTSSLDHIEVLKILSDGISEPSTEMITSNDIPWKLSCVFSDGHFLVPYTQSGTTLRIKPFFLDGNLPGSFYIEEDNEKYGIKNPHIDAAADKIAIAFEREPKGESGISEIIYRISDSLNSLASASSGDSFLSASPNIENRNPIVSIGNSNRVLILSYQKNGTIDDEPVIWSIDYEGVKQESLSNFYNFGGTDLQPPDSYALTISIGSNFLAALFNTVQRSALDLIVLDSELNQIPTSLQSSSNFNNVKNVSTATWGNGNTLLMWSDDINIAGNTGDKIYFSVWKEGREDFSEPFSPIYDETGTYDYNSPVAAINDDGLGIIAWYSSAEGGKIQYKWYLF